MLRQITIRESMYHCYLDEKHFYEWLESIVGITEVRGDPKGLVIKFDDKGLSRDDWYDLIGLFARYGIDMRGLKDVLVSEFVNAEDLAWFKDPDNYWHEKIWGMS